MSIQLKGIGIKQAAVPSGLYWTVKRKDAEGRDAGDMAVTTVSFDEKGLATVPSKKVADAMVEAYPQNISLA